MAEDLTTLVARVVADTEQFRAEMLRTNRLVASNSAKINKSLRSINRGFGGLTNSVKGFATSLGLAFGAAGIASFVRSSVQAGVSMQALQRRFQFISESADDAKQEFGFVRDEAERLGLNLENAADTYTSLAAAAKGTKLEGQGVRDVFVATSEAARVLNLSVADTEGVMRAFEQIISKGKVSAEELRQQLGERLPGAFQIAARSIGVTTGELDEMLRRGELTANELLPKMARELRATFGKDVESATNDATAAFNRFNNAVFELRAAIAEGGLLDLLTDLALVGAEAARSLDKIFPRRGAPTTVERFNFALDSLNAELSELIAERDRLTPFEFFKDDAAERLVEIRDRIREIKMELKVLSAAIAPQETTQLGLSQQQGALDFLTTPSQTIGGTEVAGISGAITDEQLEQRRKFREDMLEIERWFRDSERELAETNATRFAQLANKEAQDAIDAQQRIIDFRTGVAQAAVSLLQGVFGQSKAIQLASIAFEKLQAVRRIKLANLQAAELAFASQLIPGDPTSLIRAQAAKTATLAAGHAAVAQAVALSVVSGVAEAANVLRSNGSLGSFTNPISTAPGSSASAQAAVRGASKSVQIIFQGDVFGWDQTVRDRIVESLRDLVDNQDVILFGPESRQAAEILRA